MASSAAFASAPSRLYCSMSGAIEVSIAVNPESMSAGLMEKSPARAFWMSACWPRSAPATSNSSPNAADTVFPAPSERLKSERNSSAATVPADLPPLPVIRAGSMPAISPYHSCQRFFKAAGMGGGSVLLGSTVSVTGMSTIAKPLPSSFPIFASSAFICRLVSSAFLIAASHWPLRIMGSSRKDLLLPFAASA